jgi:hypothetical protein
MSECLCSKEGFVPRQSPGRFDFGGEEVFERISDLIIWRQSGMGPSSSDKVHQTDQGTLNIGRTTLCTFQGSRFRTKVESE